MKILIIEDSLTLRRSLRIGLSHLGHTVDESGDGAEGLSMALKGNYDLLILDVMLPSLDGITVLKAIRKARDGMKIIILSAKDTPDNKVEGLMSGADDYLTKPFSFDELHARLIALTRRNDICNLDNRMTIGEFELDLVTRQLLFNKIAIDLTHHELKVIECLFKHKYKVVSHETISEYVVGNFDAISKNAIEAHLSSARRKIKEVGAVLPVKNKRGFGYIASDK